MARNPSIPSGQNEAVSPPPNLDILYLGHSETYAIDASHRIMLTAPWRCHGAPTAFTVLLVPPLKDHLCVLPPPAFEEFLARIFDPAKGDYKKTHQLEIALKDYICRVELDAYGRLPIPPKFLAAAGIHKKALVIGRRGKFEIHPADTSTLASLVTPEIQKTINDIAEHF